MADFLTLPVIPRPFASGGDYQAPIPDDSTGTNRASFQDGWPEITSTPIADGGLPPSRLDFNGLGNLLTAYAFAMQQGQYITYSAAVAQKIGGYPKGAILWYIKENVPQYLVQSLIPNNNNADLTDTAVWQPLTINPMGMAMLGTLLDPLAAQLRNIEIVEEAPTTGVDGTIYCTIEE